MFDNLSGHDHVKFRKPRCFQILRVSPNHVESLLCHFRHGDLVVVQTNQFTGDLGDLGMKEIISPPTAKITMRTATDIKNSFAATKFANFIFPIY